MTVTVPRSRGTKPAETSISSITPGRPGQLHHRSRRTGPRLRRAGARDEDGYSPGIYDQLAATYRRAGLVKAAHRVLIAKERRHRDSNPLVKVWEWMLYLTVGFGYRKWLAAWWLAGVLLAGIDLFSRAYPAHMQPTAAKVPAFNPVVYTVDVLVPFLNLGQEQAWTPQGWELAGLWVLKGVGWPLGLAITAGLTGAFTRDKEGYAKLSLKK